MHVCTLGHTQISRGVISRFFLGVLNPNSKDHLWQTADMADYLTQFWGKLEISLKFVGVRQHPQNPCKWRPCLNLKEIGYILSSVVQIPYFTYFCPPRFDLKNGFAPLGSTNPYFHYFKVFAPSGWPFWPYFWPYITVQIPYFTYFCPPNSTGSTQFLPP